MKDTENLKAFNCLILVHQLYSSQGRSWYLDKPVQVRFRKGAFLASKMDNFFGDEGGLPLFAALVAKFNAGLCDLMQVWNRTASY